MKDMICIVCPVGCHLSIDDDLNVTGNRCPRGKEYAIKELTAPTRMLTSTVRTTSDKTPRISVKTSAAIPKELLFDAMVEIEKIIIGKDLNIGDVVIKNLLNTGIDLVATKELKI